MKLFLDTSVWAVLETLLRKRGMDVEWLGRREQQPSDAQLLADALKQQRIIVTLGEDLEARVRRERLPHYGILQLPGFALGVDQAKQCLRLLSRCQRDLLAGSIVTLNAQGISVRSPLLPLESAHESAEDA